MTEISWHQLGLNGASREISFESFNFQIAWNKYSLYGSFEYDYNTPGSEFYLTLSRDCDELNAKAGEVVGWQAKFWVNQHDPNCTSFDARNREELTEGFRRSLEAKPKLVTWIICTPGQPSNTKPHRVKDKLLEELSYIKDINILFWNKPIYEGFFHKNPDELSHIFSHYFGQKFVGLDFLKNYSLQRIRALKDKFDVELYTSGEIDKRIYPILNIRNSVDELKINLRTLKEAVQQITENENWNTADTDLLSIQYSENLKALLEALIGVSQKALSVSATTDLRILPQSILSTKSAEISLIRSLIDQTNKSVEDYESKRQSSSSSTNEIKIRRYIDYLHSGVDNILKIWNTISALLEVSLRKNIPVFGKAGYGKTYLACSICNELLNKNLPVFLFLGSDIRVGSDIKKQIRDTLSIDHSMSFLDFLGALNNLGFINNYKVPIIIDGLNETTPTANIWAHELSYLVDDINRFQNLVLITTCRDSYVEQVFNGKKHHDEVKGSIHIDGFDASKIDLVIDKYCKKYRITILNSNYERRLFKDPLMLKMFAVANEGQNIIVNEANLYNTIDKYLTTLVEKIATQAGAVNPFLKQQIKGYINTFSSELWRNNSRGLEYPDDFVKIFDPEYIPSTSNWDDTNSARVLDEGLFIKRTIVDQKEYAEFTYDRLAGFCIAKAILFANTPPEEIINKITSKELLSKLANEQQPEKNHPFREDIIQSIIFLFPQYTGKELYMVLPGNDIITLYNISMVNVFASTTPGQESFSRFVESIEMSNPNMPYLMDTIISSVISGESYWLVGLLSTKLSKMTTVQIDLIWSEATRKKSREILDYLNKLINEYESGHSSSTDIVKRQMIFVMLMMSSTNRLLRDNSTKALVTMGMHHPREMFDLFKTFKNFEDWYIIERLTASLCGVVLQINEEDLVKEIAKYLEQFFFIQIKTTHILILDYVDTILSFAEYKFGYVRNHEWHLNLDLPSWPEDEKCRENFIKRKAIWGYGPIHDDFADYIIRPITQREGCGKTRKTPTLEECLAMIVWRIRQLGYTEEIFESIDINIAKSGNYERFHNTTSTERYGKKYSWIAFFELLGQFTLKGLYISDSGQLLRTHRVDIDPSFPNLPGKKQLINDCFLPKNTEDVQDWILKDTVGYMDKIYLHNSLEDCQEWLLLYGSMNQESTNGPQVHIVVDTILVEERFEDKLISYLENNWLSDEVPSQYYLFSGEASWSKNISNDKMAIEFEAEKQSITFTYPYFVYSWESYHSEMNNIGSVPIISKEIFTELGLTFNVKEQSCRTVTGELVVQLIRDNFSKFLYIRKDLLLKYLENHGLSLVWYEYGTRNSGYKHDDQNLDPRYKDFRSVKRML